MMPQATSPLAPEASSVPEIPLPTTLQGPGLRKSSRIAAKKQNPINVCSSVCSVIMIVHDKTLKVTQSTSLMLPPPPPVGDRAETAFPRGKEKGKGKAVVKGKVHDDEDGDDEHDDEAVNDPSHKDSHDLSAQSIVQQASYHSILAEIHSADSRFH